MAGSNFFNSWGLSPNWNEKRLLNNNQAFKVRDFRGETIDDLKYHLVPLLIKSSKHITLHIGTNDAVRTDS